MKNGTGLLAFLAIALLLVGCVSDSQYNKAIARIDAAWKVENDKILATDGRRVVNLTQYEAFRAVQKTAQKLGMIVEEQDRPTGFLLAVGTAPTPLTQEEWKEVQENETENMRRVISEDVGFLAWFKDLDSTGKEVLANVFVNDTADGVEVSIAIKLRSTRQTIDRDRRLQPPPTAMRIGTEKFWRIFNDEAIIATGGKPVRMTALPTPLPAASAGVLNPPTPTSQNVSPVGPGPTALGPFPPHKTKNPDGIAVIIGNRNYGGAVPNVDYAHNDADAMREFVLTNLGYAERNIIDLRDASLIEMQRVFGKETSHKGQLWRWVRANESDVVVFYSGHGIPGLKDKRQYMLPVGSDPKSPEIDGYALETLFQNLARINARSITIYIDACFSGQSAKGALIKASGLSIQSRAPTIPTPSKQAGPALAQDQLDLAGLEIGRVPEFNVLTAAKADQTAHWNDDTNHGYFTEYLLKGLKGEADSDPYTGNNDGRVTVGETEKYLERYMTYDVKRNLGYEQHATVTGNRDYVLAEVPSEKRRSGIGGAPTIRTAN